MSVSKIICMKDEDFRTMATQGYVVIDGVQVNYSGSNLYFTDYMSADMIDDTNSAKKLVSPELAAIMANWTDKLDIPVAGTLAMFVGLDANGDPVKTSSPFTGQNGIVFDGLTIGLNQSGNITAGGFAKVGGAANQFLKADGTIDSTVYLPASKVTVQYTAPSEAIADGGIHKVILPSSQTPDQFYAGYDYIIY